MESSRRMNEGFSSLSPEQKRNALRESTLELMQKADSVIANIEEKLSEVDASLQSLQSAKGENIDATMLKTRQIDLEQHLKTERERRAQYKKDLSDLGYFVR